MNFLRSNVLVKSCNFLLPPRLIGLNNSKLLCSDLKYLTFYKCQFRPISGKAAANMNGTADETMSNRVRCYSQSRLNKFINYVQHKVRYIQRENNRNRLGFFLYRTIDEIDFSEFYRFLELPDTFHSWFVIMELHMWMLMSQVMNTHNSGIKLRNTIVMVMWRDVEARLGNLGNVNKKILKDQLRELHGRLAVTLLVYDEGLLSTDVVLASALWYKFFSKKCDDPVKLEVLVRYVRCQIQHLSMLELSDYDAAKEIKKIWVPFSNHVKEISRC